MLESQTMQIGDARDQITMLVGSAIRLLCGEAGVFVVSNAAYDPQSHSAYISYQLPASAARALLLSMQQEPQPERDHPLVISSLPAKLQQYLGEAAQGHEPGYVHTATSVCCSLFVYDQAGALGLLYCLRPQQTFSCFEQSAAGHSQHGALQLFIAQLAAGLRSALNSQSLVKEQERFAAIFRNSTDGILIVDSALRILDFNPAMEQLTGWPESEVLGHDYYDILRPKDRLGNDLNRQDSPLIQAFSGQKVVNRKMLITTRDGQRFMVSVTASCIRSAGGEPTNGILNMRDITREREQEEQRSTFISVISHELQTPIAIIKGYASTLARASAQLDKAALHSRLQAIEEEADRLNKLVGNLLYASRIQAGGLQMEIVPFDLSHLIKNVVRRLKASSPDFSVALDLPDNLPMVMADRDRIEEVLQNLLDNAIKYSSRRRAICISARSTGDEVIVSIKDAGMGIALRDQEHIFNRFQRAQDAQTQTMPGAGLGLYISRVIIEAHGGHIWVDSALHQGSTFSFSLPRVEKAQLPMVIF